MKEAFRESDRFFPTALQKFQFYDKYSRFDHDKSRRETWVEAVNRSVEFLKEISQNKLSEKEYNKLRKFILEMKATPSMRLLAMAGPAARRSNIAIYNCSYLPVDSIDSWVEALIISMNGCGVGFSVEEKHVNKLPVVKSQTGEHLGTFTISDNTEGWAEALRTGLNAWFDGKDIDFDYSLLRPAGSILRIKGGRASGPEPLKLMLDFSRKRILACQGEKLRPLDAHDIMCMVGNAAVSGGTRRTAMISLFDFEDGEMRQAKNGDLDQEWQRWNANNSAVWPERELTFDEVSTIMKEMDTGGRGEPGIFSRRAANLTKPERRKEWDFGTNPCGEIALRPYEFCNLTIAIAREDDTLETLKEKVEVATIIGTIQSMAVNFPGLRSIWKENCSEERLLGVDITGQQDCPLLYSEDNDVVFRRLLETAIETNKKYAKILGINRSAAITCAKPSGNSSQLFNCSSGIHARWAKYYIRRVRVGNDSPVYRVLKDAGVPLSPENGQTEENVTTWVASFPVKSPDHARIRHEMSAIEQCGHWLVVKTFFTEHNPSVTITYKPEELEELITWAYEHQNVIGGMSFLPFSDAKYEQMPYEEISKEKYKELTREFPKDIDFSRIYMYEKEDMTKAAQELACFAGACDLPSYSQPD